MWLVVSFLYARMGLISYIVGCMEVYVVGKIYCSMYAGIY